MFSELSNYEKDKKLYKGKIEDGYIVKDLQLFLIKVKANNKLVLENLNGNIKNLVSKKRPCDCLWTCGFYSGSSDDCEPTAGGCGFFGIQDCTGTIRP